MVFTVTDIVSLDSLNSELLSHITNIDTLIDQLRLMITQFNQYVIYNNLTVFSEDYALSVEVPGDLSDQEVAQHQAVFRDLDHIREQIDNIAQHIETASNVETQISALDNQHVSQVSDLQSKFNTVKDSYKYKN